MPIALETITQEDRASIWQYITPLQYQMLLPTSTYVANTTVSNNVTELVISHKQTTGDTILPARFRRAIGTEGNLPGALTSADGAKWIFADAELYPEWFGAKGDSNLLTGIGTDDTSAINDMIKTAAALGAWAVIPANKNYRLASAAQRPSNETVIGVGFTAALFYRDKSKIRIEGVLYHDVYPSNSIALCLLGYATPNTTAGRPGRASDVHIEFKGHGRIEFSNDLQAGRRGKMGLYIVCTDNFTVKNARTTGNELGSFQLTVTLSTYGRIDGGLLGQPVMPDTLGEDGLHIISSSYIVVVNMLINAGDDAISLTLEGGDTQLSVNKTMDNISFTNCWLRTSAAKCIKFHIDSDTTNAIIQDVTFTSCYGIAAGLPENLEQPSSNAGVATLIDSRYGALTGAKTANVAYAVGATSVAIAATTNATGKIVAGHNISFDGGATRYIVLTSNVASAAIGGTVTIAAPGLIAPVAAATNCDSYNDRSAIRKIYFNGCHFNGGPSKPDETTGGGTGRGNMINISDSEDIHFNACTVTGSSRSKVVFDRSSGSFNGTIYGGNPLPVPTNFPAPASVRSFVPAGNNWRLTFGGSESLTALASYITAQNVLAFNAQTRPYVTLSNMNNSLHNGQYIVEAVDATNRTIDLAYRRPSISTYQETSSTGIASFGLSKRPDIVLIGCADRVKIDANVINPEGSIVCYTGFTTTISSSRYNEIQSYHDLNLNLSGVTRGEAFRAVASRFGKFAFTSRKGLSQSVAINIISNSGILNAYNQIGDCTDYDGMSDPFKGFARMLSTSYNTDRVGNIRGRVPSRITSTVNQAANSTSFTVSANIGQYSAVPYAGINPTHINLSTRSNPQPFSVNWDANNALFVITTPAAPGTVTVWDYQIAPTDPVVTITLPANNNPVTLFSSGTWNDAGTWNDSLTWNDG